MARQCRRGDIFTVDFEPVRGHEQGKVRPTTIVAAITSGKRARYDVNVEVKAPEGGLVRDSLVLLNQVRTVDRSRLSHYWGRLSEESIARVDEALKISVGLVPI